MKRLGVPLREYAVPIWLWRYSIEEFLTEQYYVSEQRWVVDKDQSSVGVWILMILESVQCETCTLHLPNAVLTDVIVSAGSWHRQINIEKRSDRKNK